jgi:hypothetical protein
LIAAEDGYINWRENVYLCGTLIKMQVC